eukprot:977932-Rhodomonas_salina.3
MATKTLYALPQSFGVQGHPECKATEGEMQTLDSATGAPRASSVRTMYVLSLASWATRLHTL